MTILIAILLAIGVSGIIYLERWNQKRILRNQRSKMRYYRIIPHATTVVDGVKISRMIEQFAGYKRPELERIRRGREWFRFLVFKDKEGQLVFYLGFPEDRFTGIKKVIANIYPDAELHLVQHDDLSIKEISLKDKDVYSGYFELRQKGDREGLPFSPFDAGKDHLSDILFNLDAGEKGTRVWLDISFSPTNPRELKRVVERAVRKILPLSDKRANRFSYMDEALDFGREVLKEFDPRKGRQKNVNKPQSSVPMKVTELDIDDQERLKALKRRYTGRESAFHVAVFLVVRGNYSNSIAQTAATTISSAMNYFNGLHYARSRRIRINDIAPHPRHKELMLWTGDELANLIHLPEGSHRIYEHIPHLARGQRSLKEGELTEGVAIGTLNHPVQQGRSIRLPIEQFTKHFVLTGMTGSGKSSEAVMVSQSLIDEWIENPQTAPGFSYFDPARETVATILTRLLKAEMDGKKVNWDKIHYVYLGPTEYPIGLNLLYNGTGEETDTIVSNVLALMKHAYGGDTPQMDRIVRNSLMTLVDDPSPHTILGIVPLLTNGHFRRRIIPHVRDPIVQQFWLKEYPALESKMDQALGPILNRLSPFTTNKTMRRMFGQAEWGLSLRKYMDEGHIFLWDLLNLSKESIKLAVGHLMNQYHFTAKTRRSGSRVHIVLKDEAHLTQIPVVEKIIAEDRKFGLSLGLITQYVGQFEPWLVDAITENVGTVMTCTQGMKSAATVAAMTAGHFDKHYLQTLPERVIAVYTKIKDDTDRGQVTTFTVEADPPYVYKPDGEIANYKDAREMELAIDWGLSKGQELQKRDGKHVSDVDQEIDQYLKGQTALQTAHSMEDEEIAPFDRDDAPVIEFDDPNDLPMLWEE